MIVDIELKSDRPTERLAWFDPPSNPGSTILIHIQPDNVWRIDYQLRDDEDPEEAVKPENVIPRVQSHLEMMGETRRLVADLDHASTGRTRCRSRTIATAACCSPATPRIWCRSSACAAPTPASTTPTTSPGSSPSSSRGWRRTELLDTYSQERVFATQENLSYGTKSTEFMAPPSFAFELMRQAALGLAVKHPAVALADQSPPDLGHHLRRFAAQRERSNARPSSPPGRGPVPSCSNARSASSWTERSGKPI